jgi:sRNA-binding regulator protein Hfq
MNGKHKRFDQQRPKPRRELPTEKTGMETNYIVNLVRKRTPLVVKLTSGEEIRGYIQYYDKDFIRVTCPDRNRYFIFKHDIKYWYEETVSPDRKGSHSGQ